MKKGEVFRLVTSIKKAGFRATQPRLAVLSALEKAKYPLSIKEIIRRVSKTRIDQVTIYRILEAFKKAGLVAQVDFQHGRAYYELKDVIHDHHHIICMGCKRIEDFVGCEYEKLVGKALKQTKGFATITEHSLELFGLCRSCFKNNVVSA